MQDQIEDGEEADFWVLDSMVRDRLDAEDSEDEDGAPRDAC